jgi:SAM-dependent methyltransferase
MTDIAVIKQQARATWAAGDFDAVAELIWEVGGVAAEAAQCGPSDRVLDIAAGSGDDASFDVALSTFGIMFAPRQSVAAAELARVLKPGGRIALCAHELLDDAFKIRCEPRILIQRYDAPIDTMTDDFMARFGPMVMARRALEPQGRCEEFLAVYRELTHRWNQGEDGKAALPAAYLLVTGTRR